MTGCTRLFNSFATIDPAAFTIASVHPNNSAMMREFTALTKPGLQANKVTPTHRTYAWGELSADKAYLTASIASVKNYMDKYGFTNVDLDWEHPADPNRSGDKLTDTRNLILLVEEIRATFDAGYGISLALAPGY